MKTDILRLYKEELTDALIDSGFGNIPKFRVAQIYDWLHKKLVSSFDEMTNLPKELRAKLNDKFVIFRADVEKKSVSMYDDTAKYLFRLDDGEFIESVVMKYKYGRSICVSTEIGCNMGCRFCASTMGGMKRRLSAGEMLAQVYSASRDLKAPISHCVLMGMGEPLDNYDEVVRFIRLLSSPEGHDMSVRHISLSTSGIVPGILKLADEELSITLSISLHAPNDQIRSSLMPVNSRWNVDEVLEACRQYQKICSRRISFEYAMISGVNDSPECAKELAHRLRGIMSHINLIPVNEVPGTPFRRSGDDAIKEFEDILSSRGFPVTVRRRLGSDINASCGQLRRSVIAAKNNDQS